MSKRLISLILVLILLITALASCKKTPVGDDSESSNTSGMSPESETDAPDPFYEIPLSELENYSIVYSENVTDDVMDAINTLASALSMKFGILMRTKDDTPVNYKGESQIGDYEIIIGDTRREESVEFLSELEYGDRGYKII